jgi:hypothetical protein
VRADNQRRVSVFGHGDLRVSAWILRFSSWAPAVFNMASAGLYKALYKGRMIKKTIFFFARAHAFMADSTDALADSQPTVENCSLDEAPAA